MLVRSIKPEQAVEIVDLVLEHVNIVEEKLIHDKAAEIALLTGCRAVDAYYIAAAKHVNGTLVTNDRVMKRNALRAGVEACYLLDNKDYMPLIDKLAAN